MLFNSAGYLVFFTIVCLVYFILPKKSQESLFAFGKLFLLFMLEP